MKLNRLKVANIVIFLCFLGTLSSCQESKGTAIDAKVDENSGNITPYMAVIDAFACKQNGQIFVAAHRGTHKGSKYPENALESLKALYIKGINFAEIDISRLKDGSLILYHDGTWDRGSTGTGVVARTNWPFAQKLLLKDTRGKVTAIRPSELEDILRWAKYKMYLEIDFKSSVNEAKVIDAIKSADMIKQVILISYSKQQAIKLHKLAPTAAISVKMSKPGDIKAYEAIGIPQDVMMAWTGRRELSQRLAIALRSKNIPILASGKYSNVNKINTLPDLLVTDYALDVRGDFIMKDETMNAYTTCMTEKQNHDK